MSNHQECYGFPCDETTPTILSTLDTKKNANSEFDGHCQNRYDFNVERMSDFFANLTVQLAPIFSKFLDNYVILTFTILSVLLVLFVLYKSYWSPMLYYKELTDVGYNHIRPGPNKKSKITRTQEARKLGTKLPPPYPNGWFAVAESRDVKIGDVVAVDVLGQNLCVYRGTDGVARCVDAYCPHLGANMAIGGTVRGKCIECPFHKWRFHGDSGACVLVPDQDAPPKGVAVKSWTTTEADQAIWVWHDAEGREPLWPFSDAPELKNWGYRGRNEFVVYSHIQDIPENGADIAHLNAVHSTSMLSTLGDKYPFLLNFIGQHIWSARWNQEGGHVSQMNLVHDYVVGKLSFFHMDVVAVQIGPAHVRLHLKTAMGPFLIVQSVTPLSPLEQKVVHRIFSPAYNAPIGAAFVLGESYMFERDIAIWNHKRFVSNPTYVKTDKTIRLFRNWYSQFYSENSLSFKDALSQRVNPLDW